MQKMQNLTENHPADIRMVPGLKVEKNFLIQFIFIAGILFIGAINSFNSVIGALSAILFIFFLCSAFLKNHKKIMLIIVIFSIVMHFYPLLFQIKNYDPFFVYDINILVKAGTQKLLSGENPYSTTFYGTEMDAALLKDGPFWISHEKSYFAMEKFVYPPGIFLLTVPFYLLFSEISVLALYFVMLILDILLISTLIKDMQKATIALVLLFLNPIFIFSSKFNSIVDFSAFTFLILATFFYLNKNKTLAGICFGAFISTKQFALLAVPFILFFFLKNNEKKMLIAAFLTIFLIFAPFMLWSPSDYFNDTISPIFCSTENCYPNLAEETPVFYSLTPYTHSYDNILTATSAALLLASFALIFYKFVKLEKINLQALFMFSGIFLIIAVFLSKMGLQSYYEFGLFMVVFAVVLSLKEKENA